MSADAAPDRRCTDRSASRASMGHVDPVAARVRAEVADLSGGEAELDAGRSRTPTRTRGR